MHRPSPRLAILLAVFALPAFAADPATPRADVVAEMETALLNLGARNALGDASAPLELSRPARLRYALGAVVDRTPGTNGLKVLAIGPASAAARIGLQPGDVILAANGQRFASTDAPGAALDQAVAAHDGAIALQVQRGARTLALAGRADSEVVPAFRLVVGSTGAAGCAFASDQLGTPPLSRQIHRAEITAVDGRSTPLSRLNRYRLEPGRHVLTVAERIPAHHMSWTARQQVEAMQAREGARAYKPLVLDVQADRIYLVGARLLPDHLDTAGIRANGYWEPVVYVQKPAACR